MGDSGPPPPPDYAAANRAGIQADIDTLPIRYETQLKYQPMLDALNSKSLADRLQVALDSEAKRLPQQLDIQAKYQPIFDQIQRESLKAGALDNAQTNLELQQKYGSQLTSEALKRVEEADPEGTAIRKKLAAITLGDLTNPEAMSAEEKRQIQQSVRAGGAARGDSFSPSQAWLEAFQQGEYGRQLKQQRMQNAGSFLSGVSPAQNFANVNNAGRGVTPFQPNAFMPLQLGNAPYAQQQQVLDPNAGARGTQFAMQSYQQQSTNWANTKDPLMEGLGMAMGAGASLGSAAMM